MRAPRDRRHLIVGKLPEISAFRPPPRVVRPTPIPAPPSRPAHGRRLAASLEAALRTGSAKRAAAAPQAEAEPVLTIEFESRPGLELNVASLEMQRSGIEVLSVHEIVEADKPTRQVATVRVPEKKIAHFLKRFEKYGRETPRAPGEVRYEDSIDRVNSLRLATLRSLWTDQDDAYPPENRSIWWEVWLRHSTGEEYERFVSFARDRRIRVSERRLVFDDRVVFLAHSTPESLAASVDVLGDLAEVRRAHEATAFFDDLPTVEQADWIRATLRTLTAPPPGAPAVCILDTGVNRGHPMLAPIVRERDVHSVDPKWPSADDGGHGTSMAGLGAYGDLGPILESRGPVVLTHGIESVKILPPQGRNPPELYGAVTALAAATIEAANPQRRRVFSMAVTAPHEFGPGLGAPTLWSAAVDALAAGRSFDSHTNGLTYLDDGSNAAPRLLVVSAGNVSEFHAAHLDRSDATEVEDPGQAWNALVVGACTERSGVLAGDWRGWRGISPPGELSPYSTTSLPFGQEWPIKPDVVFEGGNVGLDNDGASEVGIPELNLLSLHHRPPQRLLTLASGTSAASTQVARLCALVSSDYPELWPETLRALAVHSARWTKAMADRGNAVGKRERLRLLRRYGYGVPDAGRMRRSATDALTLIVQGQIHPFAEGKMREMHLHALPWPREVLASLGAAAASLRVTLSYFVEPNPGRRGWQKRHRYASHGLRFDVMRAAETTLNFQKRVNQAALDEDEKRPRSEGSDNWYFGPKARDRGSIHSDMLEATAADLASRGAIAVYPVGGWWKELPKRDRSALGARYALVISVETPDVAADIWTPVAEAIGIEIS
ncbi:MAG: S8 family peptidase [Planctomycetes bacterium]|nr:S8 family peptidase [Planctomycetota bacterium]